MARLTKEELIAFEDDIVKSFNNKEIRSPIHLYSNVEEQMIEIFDNRINNEDYLFLTWRSHYQCLLHGVPKDKLKAAILENRSISLCFPEFNIYSSAIVGGSIPIAVGYALGLKLSQKPGKAVCFVGDMASCGGQFHEAIEYSKNHNLSILFIVEDNNKSVCTPTRQVWNTPVLYWEKLMQDPDYSHILTGYYYSNKYPHSGAGQRIQF